MLQALEFSLQEPTRAVVAGEPSNPATETLISTIHSVFQPNRVVLGNVGAVEPFAKTLPAQNGAVAYICTGTTCQPPTTEPHKVKKLLQGKA
jgi:uncharacterized protein YyaL (SSP411 family)